MSPSTLSLDEEAAAVEQIREGKSRIEAELSKVIVGQSDVIEQLLICLVAGGHCLITGAPGLAKTLLVRSVAQIFHLRFQRIQFTPDLMPADITGTEILEEDAEGRRSMQFVRGPIFANVILADEINRTPPKTQAALLEAMQEHQVTAGGRRYELGVMGGRAGRGSVSPRIRASAGSTAAAIGPRPTGVFLLPSLADGITCRCSSVSCLYF